jgi:hypothetical protein
MTEEPSPLGELRQITSAEFLQARKLCHRTPKRVCRELGIARATLLKAENPLNTTTSRYLASKLRAYYEAAGVEFIEANGGGPGVRMGTSKES